MQFPDEKTVSKQHPFSDIILEKALTAVYKSNREFSGYLRIECEGEGVYFLFFLENAACAAGKYFKKRPKSLTVKELFREVISRPPEGMQLSLHQAGKDLLNDFLIFTRVEPTVKAPVNLIDLEAISSQIAAEEANALVMLESEGCINFFYFEHGQPLTAHFSKYVLEEEGLAVDEQMLLYAFRPGAKVNANIYRNITIDYTKNLDDGNFNSILSLFHEAATQIRPPQIDDSLESMQQATQAIPRRTVNVTVMEGSLKGTTQTGRLPFTIGRKEGEMLISDPLISRRHAVIREVNGSLVVEDLGSTNGTFINGIEIKIHQISSGDKVTVGGTVVQIIVA